LQIDQLIKELIATGAMNEDTLADLNRMQADFEGGKLDPDDEVYLRALHARLTNAPLPEPEIAAQEPGRIEGHTIAEWRDRALRAEAEVAALRDQLAGETTSS
jgi:hypothetical protein